MSTITLERQGVQWTPVAESTRCGVVGFISWMRLIEQLERAGEIQPSETVERLRISEHGIEYTVVRRHP